MFPSCEWVIRSGTQDAEPLTAVLDIVIQLLIRCCSYSTQMSPLAAAECLYIHL